MDLELKHIVPYLPYGLQMAYRVKDGVFEPKGILQTVSFYADATHQERVTLQGMDSEHIWMFKPILRPINDLRNLENEINTHSINLAIGKNGSYGDVILDADTNGIDLECSVDDYENTHYLAFSKIETVRDFLLAGHYDIFGLIPLGLAIDVSSIS